MKTDPHDVVKYLGKEIEIEEMATDSNEAELGLTGIVLKVGRDCDGDIYLTGTWSSDRVYPDYDKIKIVSRVN